MPPMQTETREPDDPSRPPNWDEAAGVTADDLNGRSGLAGESDPGDDDLIEIRGEGEQTPARTTTPTPQRTALEAEAREMGWIDREHFRGDPARFVDASTFMRRANEVLPIVKSRLTQFETENTQLKTQVEEMRETLGSMLKTRQINERAAVLQERSRLKDERKEATANGDSDRIVDIDARLRELDTPAPTSTPDTARAAENERAAKAVWEDNLKQYPWMADKAVTEDWHAEARLLRSAGNQLTGQAFVTRVNDRMRRIYPERFTNGSRHSMVDGGGDPTGNRGGSGGERSYANLTTEYKRACNRAIKYDLVKTQKEFLEQCGPECFLE